MTMNGAGGLVCSFCGMALLRAFGYNMRFFLALAQRIHSSQFSTERLLTIQICSTLEMSPVIEIDAREVSQ
jgi:hypothetical protein